MKLGGITEVSKGLCALALLGCTLCSTDAAHSQTCNPVLNGAILNVAPECLNDSTALIVSSSSAQNSGWQCSTDINEDGVNVGQIGGGDFEIYGMAIRELQDEVWIVINTNLPLGGISLGGAEDGNVGWGDLFINLSDTEDFKTASTNQTLYGIRFSDRNDSCSPMLGVYKDVNAKSVTSTNMGFGSWDQYANHVLNREKIPELGDFGANQTYYAGDISYNVIDQGTFVGPIVLLTDQELTDAGYDCSTGFDGTTTIAFRFEKRLIIDKCGVIGGDGTSCSDCFGVPCGIAQVDQCNVCGGDGTSCLDCNGEPFGNAVIDECNVCDGDGTSCLDCADVPFGDTGFDQCGVCGGDGKSCLDCANEIFGNAQTDRCGVCGGDGSACLTCEDHNITDTQTLLDHGAKLQEKLIVDVLKRYQGNTKGKKAKKAAKQYAAKIKAVTHDLQISNWILSWQLPSVFSSCANSFCVHTSNEPILSTYRIQSEQLRQIGLEVIAKFKTSLKLKKKRGKKKKRAKRRLNRYSQRNETLHIDNMKLADLVPLTASDCS